MGDEGNKAEEITGAERRGVKKFRELAAEMAGLPDVPALERAVDFYARHIRACTRRAPVKQLVSELLNAKEKAGCSGRHLDNLRLRLAKFSAVFGARDAREISAEEIGDWLYALRLSSTSLDNYRRVLLKAVRPQRHRSHRDPPNGMPAANMMTV